MLWLSPLVSEVNSPLASYPKVRVWSLAAHVATGAEPYRVPTGCREIRVQAWGAGFLYFALLMALFGNEVDYRRTHWNNVFVTVVLILIGFYVSDLVCRAARRAGLSDPLGSWSYVIGIVVTGVVYIYGWRA